MLRMRFLIVFALMTRLECEKCELMIECRISVILSKDI